MVPWSKTSRMACTGAAGVPTQLREQSGGRLQVDV